MASTSVAKATGAAATACENGHNAPASSTSSASSLPTQDMPVPTAVSLNLEASSGLVSNLLTDNGISMNVNVNSSMDMNTIGANTDNSANSDTKEVGRIKPKPVCQDETMRRRSMTQEQLVKYCFAMDCPPPSTTTTALAAAATDAASTVAALISKPSDAALSVAMVSSSSSTASNASTISSFECDHAATGGITGTTVATAVTTAVTTAPVSVPPPAKDCPATPARLSNLQSERINQKVTSRKVSRNGRKTQRWHTDGPNNRVCRLVTGCIPILESGKILFVSASRKPEWILPKGGWEQDELMEESAIRESFEEAGVLGVLGPRLAQIDYETRKSKKRRMEFEQKQKEQQNNKQQRQKTNVCGDAVADDNASRIGKITTTARATAVSPIPEMTPATISCDIVAGNSRAGSVATTQSQLNHHQQPDMCATPSSASYTSVPTTPSIKKTLFDDTLSVSSETSTYSHVRMTLFPLYVCEVKKEWPESGRFRTAVDIDDAIKMCENRPEFRQALIEVKDRNLHMRQDNANSAIPQPSAPVAQQI